MGSTEDLVKKEESSGHGGLTFGFAKTKKKSNLVRSSLNDEIQKKEDELDFVKEVNRREGIKGSKVKEVKKELVIPCQKNTIANLNTPKDDLTVRAEQELIADAIKAEREAAEPEPGVNAGLEVALPGRKNAEEKEIDPSSLDDYESIPVEGFGMGMLRGMGFKAGEGIGGFKKADVKCIDPVMRPKGLGLGATRPKKASETGKVEKDEDGEELVLKKGAHALVLSGSHRKLYGKVEGLDEESARIFLKLAVGNETVSISENALKVVGKKEYKKYSKVINKDMFEEYDKKQKSREVEWDRGKEDQRSQGKKRRSRSRSRSPAEKKYKKSSDSSSKSSSSSSSSRSSSWLHPLLRVRFIDDRFKSGKLYNTKVTVEDVPGRDSCVIKTQEGRVYEDIPHKMLETLIPKNEGAIVMIVVGKYRGRLGEILRRNKRDCIATVQTVPDRDEVLNLDFDEICEYVGNVSEI